MALLWMMSAPGAAGAAAFASSTNLAVGIACHAFEHLGNIGHQAEAAAAAGANIIYASGLGGDGYSGLPAPAQLEARRRQEAEYVRLAKSKGIEVVLGYICATSMVGLKTFDKEWTAEFRAQFQTVPAQWRQQDREGRPLASWYGGAYEAACMNNPDWRAYEKFIVRQQIETGHGGIFFDNPTVHPQGCYCGYCLAKFAAFLGGEGRPIQDRSLEVLRKVAEANPVAFQRFRCTVARDFLAEMRTYARTLSPNALVTANNSLNSASVLFAQCQSYAYNIFEMSQAEDLVVVEDMGSQPRVTSQGKYFEYGPTYNQLHAISHGRPVVAVTIADADYHTAPNLVRLAMAEAAANQASYVVWTTWPEEHRPRLIAATRRQRDFLRQHQPLLASVVPRQDALLFLPFRRWVETNVCMPSRLAAELSRANVQFTVVSEEDFTIARLRGARLFIAESAGVLKSAEQSVLRTFERQGGRVIWAKEPDWLEQVRRLNRPSSLSLEGEQPALRARVCDQKDKTVVHLLNLGVERVSSFEDRIHPLTGLRLAITVPFQVVRSVELLTADAETSQGRLEYELTPSEQGGRVNVTIPKLEVAALLVIVAK